MAHALGIDPVALRVKNHAETDLHENKPFSNKKLLECYRIGAERFGWSRRSSAPRSMRDGNMLVGWGMATTTYPANRRPAAASATLYADGNVVVRSGTQDLGTGTYTVMAQVAADALGMPLARVRFELGDSRFPKAPVSGGSSTVASVSPAVQAACMALRERILDLAQQDNRAGLGGVARADLHFADGVIVAPSGRVRVAELFARRGTEQISASADAKPGDEKQHYSMHSFGAQFAEVRVDPELGEIRVARLLGVFDAGRVLNAKTARSQLIGGMVFGLGMALLEQTHVDAEIGRITNANVADYLMAVQADVPRIDTVLVDNSDTVVDPIGARGLGELPTVGVAAAIANAVFHATGKRVRDLPIRIEDVLA
jgi:xanthine dehydrogenase YagR molybdenum-binding subunit